MAQGYSSTIITSENRRPFPLLTKSRTLGNSSNEHKVLNMPILSSSPDDEAISSLKMGLQNPCLLILPTINNPFENEGGHFIFCMLPASSFL
ncbi:hypothetical protein VC83_03282 [Pseudogymnoascus destructans]|uniref:Uncharacterized protein n=1 Tax=Pseudogymnoascus destructans TaxID=655981 RepID=A0A177AE12_9PEZI|nr:uncharacterized protein VC83_03282 [Pseudogymnoascus destructans]OAF60349.2 hypothetical protein VC83_03282 [Pseudogymnoascus destructans]